MNNYTAADGRRFWIVGLEADRHWPPLCRAVGHPEWLADSRFATARDRARNSCELIAVLDEIFAARTLAEWAEIFDGEPELFWAPVNSMEDVLGDEQFHAAGGLVDVPTATGRRWSPLSPTSTAPRGAAVGRAEARRAHREVLTELRSR